MIKAVVWDIGNVFAVWDPESHYDQFIGEKRRKMFFAETEPHKMNEAIDLGGHSEDVASAHAKRHPKWAFEILSWHSNWAEMFKKPVPGTAHIFNAVKARSIPCFALSNFGANTYEVAQELHPILKEFDREFISGRLGMIKPDQAFYEEVECKTGYSGDELIFVDDRPENIAAADVRGWRTHRFENPEGWAERLVQENILSASDLAL